MLCRQNQIAHFLCIIATILTLNFSSCATINNEEGRPANTIQMIAALIRHGDRSPTELYPKDPHINHEWPGGLGALSQKGALQLYNLGKNLRLRYSHLLPKDGQYSQKYVSVKSSYAERCIMSAQSLLASFMTPLPNKNLLPIDWQPVPVHSIPRNVDHLLAQTKPCKKYDSILESLYVNPPPDLKEMNEKNRGLYRLLTKHTGLNITSSRDIKGLYETLLIEDDANLILSDWTENIFPEQLIPFAERYNTLSTETKFMKKIKGGPFITEIFQIMKNKKNNNDIKQRTKIFLYFGHEHTLMNVLNSLNVLDQIGQLLDYASAIIFELHLNSDLSSSHDFEVKIFYYANSEVNSPKEIFIPKCKHSCSLKKFEEAVQHLLIDNYDELCENISTSVWC